MNYYIGDLHFGQEDIIAADKRPYSSIAEMDQALIDNWNKKVSSDEDKVYIIGDFCYLSDKEPEWYLSQLKGRKYLIIGNHDDSTLESLEARKYLHGIYQIKRIKDEGRKIVLCHFPLADWQGSGSGAYHIFAHIGHDRLSEASTYMNAKPNAFNAGCMLNNYEPVTLDELILKKQDLSQT